MGPNTDFSALVERVFTLHTRGQYREALAVVQAAAGQFPDRAERTSYWTACLQSRLGESDHAITTLQEGLARGLWWSPEMLDADPDLDPVRHRDEFATIVAACNDRLQAAQSTAVPDLQVMRPDRPALHGPLLIALHWRGRSAADFATRWQPATRRGVIVALPRSSQQLGMDAFGWDDRERARAEVAAAYATLSTTETFDPRQVILAGASQGAALAIQFALAGDPVPAMGFIAVVPAIRDADEFAPEIEMAAHRGVLGWLLTGELDASRQAVEALHARLTRAGTSCQLQVVPGLAHDFPADFALRLIAAIDFVLSEAGALQARRA